MRPPRPLAEWVLRIAAAIGLGISGILLYEYLRPASGICGEGGGCDVIRQSKYAFPLGIPTPVFGLVYFGVVVGLSFVPKRLPLLVWTAGGALAAAFFFYVQGAELQSWCKYCVVADSAASVTFATALFLRRSAPALGKSAFAALPVLSFVAAAAFFAPVMVNRIVAARAPAGGTIVAEQELPAVVAREQRPGVATIVEYLDFECPYCRELHHRLERILPSYGDKVRVVRKMFPLSMHLHAEQTARAYCCADEVGKGEEMANALMSSENLTNAGCEQAAEKLGMDLDAFRDCLKDRRTAERVKAELDEGRAAGVRGLPAYWIGKQRFTGLVSEAQLRAGIDAALKAR